jgi:hypothetical protein
MITAGGSSDSGLRSRCTLTSDNNLLPVRCCADVDVEEGTTSDVIEAPVVESGTAQTCAQLGWATGMHPAVCTSPMSVYEQTCPMAMSKSDASTYCASTGARLCGLADVLMAAPEMDVVCGTHAKRVWVADDCLFGETSVAGSATYEPTFPLQCTPPGDELLSPLCCADVVSTAANALSQRPCADLDWAMTSADVCASSTPNGRCGLAMIFADATMTCAGLGGRLCSAAELVGDLAAGTGCELDDKRVWSSDACDGGVYTTSGSARFADRIPRQCSPVFGRAQVRCCADAAVLMPDDEGYWPMSTNKVDANAPAMRSGRATSM